MQSQNPPLPFKLLDARGQSGSTLIQVCVVLAVLGVVSTFAIISFSNTRANLRLQNTTRQLAQYMEKARLDAIRRHSTSTVTFTDERTYDITMDWASSGEPTTRTFQFEDGVNIISTPLPSLTFNWRGRTQSCTVTFAVQNSRGEQSWLDV